MAPQIEQEKQTAVEQLALQLTFKTGCGRYLVDNTEDVTDEVNRAKATEEHQQIKAQLAILCDFQRTLDGNDTKENSIWYRVNELKRGLISLLPGIDSDGGANGPQGTEGPTGVQIPNEKAEQETLEQRLSALEQKVEQLSQPKKFAQGSTFDRYEEIKRFVEEWKKSVGLNFELVGEDIKNSSEQEKSSSERGFVEFDPKDYSFEKELAALDEMHKKLLVDFACEAYDIKYRSDDSFRNVATELYNKIYNSKTNESNTRHQ
jgi:hypothetical protein